MDTSTTSTPPPDDLLTGEALCAVLHISARSLRRMEKAGLPSLVLPGTSMRRYPGPACRAWIAQQQPADRPGP